MIRQKLQQQQTQRLVMTPQLQQAVKLLQLSTIELEQVIEQEIEQNPVLELSEPTTPETNESTPSDIDNIDNHSAPETETYEPEDIKAIEEINWDDLLPDDRSWESMEHTASSNEDFEQYIQTHKSKNTVGKDIYEYLLTQIRYLPLTSSQLEISEEIIGNIEPDGYLRTPLNDIANHLGKSLEECEQVLRIIQQLDPPGIGARDLRECLYLQYSANEHPNPVIVSMLSSEYFPDFVNHHFTQLAKKLKVSIDDIESATREISKLDPKPGFQYSNDAPHYITPDVIISNEQNGQFEIAMNDDQLPQLKISPKYLEMLKNKDKLSPKDYEFLIEKFRSARALIRNIERRKNTIMKVTEEIVKTQKEFLEKGLAYLKPLKLREIADRIGVHESTVARVTSNKYVHTPQGTFELKYFFSQGLDTDQGESVSTRSIKSLIQELISQENPNHPLSDQIITDILNSKGIHVARRTIVKYREVLNILPSHLRKKRNSLPK